MGKNTKNQEIAPHPFLHKESNTIVTKAIYNALTTKITNTLSTGQSYSPTHNVVLFPKLENTKTNKENTLNNK